MKRIFILILLLSTVLIVSAEQEEKPKLAIVPFKAIGDLPKDSGEEIAALIVGVIDQNYYDIKERLNIESVVRENIFTNVGIVDIKKTKEIMKNFEVDCLLLGTITKTIGEYNITYYISSKEGDISNIKANVYAANWDVLKERLKTSIKETLNKPYKKNQKITIELIIKIAGGSVSGLGVLFLLIKLFTKKKRKEIKESYVETNKILIEVKSISEKIRDLCEKIPDLIPLKKEIDLLHSMMETNKNKEKGYIIVENAVKNIEAELKALETLIELKQNIEPKLKEIKSIIKNCQKNFQ